MSPRTGLGMSSRRRSRHHRQNRVRIPVLADSTGQPHAPSPPVWFSSNRLMNRVFLIGPAENGAEISMGRRVQTNLPPLRLLVVLLALLLLRRHQKSRLVRFSCLQGGINMVFVASVPSATAVRSLVQRQCRSSASILRCGNHVRMSSERTSQGGGR